MVMALTDTGGASSSMAAPTSTPTPAPTPLPTAHGILLATPSAQPTLVHAPTVPHAPEPEADDTPDVEIVPGPPRPVAELIDVTDDRPDTSGGRSDVQGEVADNPNVEPVGGTTADYRFLYPAPARFPSHPPPQALHEHGRRPTERPHHANSTARRSQHPYCATSRHRALVADTVTASSYEPERTQATAQQTL